MKLAALVLAAALLPAAAFGADRQFVKGEPVVLAPDQGYVLVRTIPGVAGAMRVTTQCMPILVRTLSKEELDRAAAAAITNPRSWTEKLEPNVVEPLADRAYAEDNDQIVMVTSLKPGTYVIEGMAITNWLMGSAGVVVASMSMGTVKFEVKPGVLTDMGTLLCADDELPTDIPELSGQVAGKLLGFSVRAWNMALRPVAAATPVPAKLQGLAIMPADYSAVPPHPNYLGAPLTRLPSVPGVLDYDANGNVIDPKAVKPPPPVLPAPSVPPARL